MTLHLPWPPSVNHYWHRNRHGGMRVGEAGLAFRSMVTSAIRRVPVARSWDKGIRLRALVEAHPPDRRARDLDNIQKAIFDALKHAEVYADDSQLDEITVRRRDIVKGGRVEVTIEALP